MRRKEKTNSWSDFKLWTGWLSTVHFVWIFTFKSYLTLVMLSLFAPFLTSIATFNITLRILWEPVWQIELLFKSWMASHWRGGHWWGLSYNGRGSNTCRQRHRRVHRLPLRIIVRTSRRLKSLTAPRDKQTRATSKSSSEQIDKCRCIGQTGMKTYLHSGTWVMLMIRSKTSNIVKDFVSHSFSLCSSDHYFFYSSIFLWK